MYFLETLHFLRRKMTQKLKYFNFCVLRLAAPQELLRCGAIPYFGPRRKAPQLMVFSSLVYFTFILFFVQISFELVVVSCCFSFVSTVFFLLFGQSMNSTVSTVMILCEGRNNYFALFASRDVKL